MLGLSVGIILGRSIAEFRDQKLVRHLWRSRAKSDGKEKLTRESLIRMIEENRGPYGLDLSKKDFSELDLSIEAVTREFERGQHMLPEGEALPYWVSKLTGGIRLVQADFRGAFFRRTNLKSANFLRSDLRGANLRGANLEDVSFFEADLRGVSLYLARLQSTQLTVEQLGRSVWEEKSGRLQEARDTYRALKNNFNGIGSYRDASWAYVKERQMQKNMHWPLGQARISYSDELEGLAEQGARRWVQLLGFYLRHLVSHTADWIMELVCGYGEKPVRTLWWALVVILAFPSLYRCSGGVVLVDDSLMTPLDYLNYSLGAFTTIGFARFETMNWVAEMLTGLEALLGIAVLALLMFALGNRISRS